MAFHVPLAHGVLGLWDEVIPVGLLVVIGIVAWIVGVMSRRRGDSVESGLGEERADVGVGNSEGKADEYRLD